MLRLVNKKYFLLIFFFIVVYLYANQEKLNQVKLGQLATRGAVTEAVFILKNQKNKFEEHRNKVALLKTFNIDKSVYEKYLEDLEFIIRDFENNIDKIPKINNLTFNMLKDQVDRSVILYDILKYRDKVYEILFNIFLNKSYIDRINKILEKKGLRLKKLENSKNNFEEINNLKKSMNYFKNKSFDLKNNIYAYFKDLDYAKEALFKIEKKYKDVALNFVDFESTFYKSQFLKKIEPVLLK